MGDAGAHCEFCIICAKPGELTQLISVFDAKFKRIRGNNLSDRVYKVGSDMKVRVTTCSSMGNTSAAIRTAQMITTSQPAIMIFLGTAASLKPDEVQIGDVVIPRKAVSRIYEKISEHGQRDYNDRADHGNFREFFFEKNALISELSTIECSEAALTAVAGLNDASVHLEEGQSGSIKLAEREISLRKPKIHDDIEIFSCGMVIDSITYREFITKSMDQNLRKVAIVDMESYGFFKSIDATSKSGVGTGCSGVMIRGISDYAGRKSQTEARPEGWKEKSVRNAAIVAAALIEQLCYDF